MLQPPYPELNDLLEMMGKAGRRLSDIEASEGAAGNLSLCLRWPIEPRTHFPLSQEIELPQAVPELMGARFLVTGSGCRLRDIADEPDANLACLVVNRGGKTANLYTSPRRAFERVTSEFNSHLAVHHDQILSTGTNFHAIVHAQPVHLTYLSHVSRYQDEKYLNTHLLRWQPETIVNLPEGIGFIPFRLPSSDELMAINVDTLRRTRMVLWAKHGVMSRSEVSVQQAVDLVDYAETAARYEYLNLTVGEIGEGLSREEILAICRTFNIQQTVY